MEDPFKGFQSAVVSQWCLSGVSVVSQWCLSGVSVVSQWCLSGDLVVSQWCLSGVSVVSQWCLSGVFVVSQWPGSVFCTSRLATLGGSWHESKVWEANFLISRFQEEAKTDYLMINAYPKKYQC